MSKIIRIDRCEQCPHFERCYFNAERRDMGHTRECTYGGGCMEIRTLEPIADFCPLEDWPTGNPGQPLTEYDA